MCTQDVSHGINFNPRSLTGATQDKRRAVELELDFNPRSLTGATFGFLKSSEGKYISIHAPSRERQLTRILIGAGQNISIHAPSRERLYFDYIILQSSLFQSTLPHGSDTLAINSTGGTNYFNPRSLTGATTNT